jgi:hypothetical protein
MAKRFMTRYGFARIVTILGSMIWEIRPKAGKKAPLTEGFLIEKNDKKESDINGSRNRR